MKFLLALIFFISVVSCDKWAVLVAGSNTFANYRHQADVFHAYQILKKNGFAENRIITFAYDDVANNIKNPFKGKVYNKPTYKEAGVDVYAGVVIDYKAANVDPKVFLDVLEGNQAAVKGKGSGRVLESTKDDNVFLFFADHGAPGLIAFPSKYLYAKDLIATFTKMNGRYNKLVFYLESCQSGSMFTSLVNNTKIYALSAANPSESSWGTYCSPDDVVQGKHIGSCLGDLFSVNFLENTESTDLFSISLIEQFNIIKTKTNQSHVMQWGDLSYNGDKVSEFLAASKVFSFKFGIPKLSQLRRNGAKVVQSTNFNSRTLKMQSLMAIHERQQTKQSLQQFLTEVHSMRRYDDIFFHFLGFVPAAYQKYDAYNIRFDCLKQSIDYFELLEGRFSDYGLDKIKLIAKACQIHTIDEIKQKLRLSIEKVVNTSSVAAN